MSNTRKGKTYHHGMKFHIGVHAITKIIHSLVTTPANVHDSQVIEALLHGREKRIYADSAYTGQAKAIQAAAPGARDFSNAKGFRNRKLTEEDRRRNWNKSRVRAKVEHQFNIIKRLFGFNKTRYKGLAKNTHRLFMASALSNLVMVKRVLLRDGQSILREQCA